MASSRPQGAKRPRGSPEPIPGRCGAKLARSDPPRYCTQWPRKGRDRCGLHGGTVKRGAESPNFKHGQASRYYAEVLSGHVLEGYLAAQNDDQLLGLEEQIRLWTGREWELVRRLSDSGESREAWARIRDLAGTIAEVRRRPTPTDADRARSAAELGRALDELLGVALEGASREGAWEDLQEAGHMLRRLKEAERRRLEAAQAMLTVQETMHLMAVITQLALRCITTGGNRGRDDFADGIRRLSRGETIQLPSGAELGTRAS